MAPTSEEILKAIDAAGGHVPTAAVKMGVCNATVWSWIAKRGLAREVRRRHPYSSNGNQIVRPDGPDVIMQIEREQRDRYVSFADKAGNMFTFRPACPSELARIATIINREVGESHVRRLGDEQERIIGDMQVSCAAERERHKRLKDTVRRVCGPIVATAIFKEAEEDGCKV